MGVATNDELESDLTEAGITLVEGSGAIGGVTGALVADCYHDDVPAAVLIVRSNPSIPDPGEESLDDETHRKLNDALWEYCERVVELAQQTPEEFVWSADVETWNG